MPLPTNNADLRLDVFVSSTLGGKDAGHILLSGTGGKQFAERHAGLVARCSQRPTRKIAAGKRHGGSAIPLSRRHCLYGAGSSQELDNCAFAEGVLDVPHSKVSPTP